MKTLKIRTRLGLDVAVMLGLMLTVATIGIRELAAVAQAARNMTSAPLTKERLISDWYSNINAAVNRTTMVAKSSDPNLIAYAETTTIESARHAAELQAGIAKLLASNEEKQLFAEILKSGMTYEMNGKDVFRLRLEGKLFQARTLFEKSYLPSSKKYLHDVQSLLDLQRKTINAAATDIEAAYQSGRMLLLVLSVTAIACGIAAP